MSTWGIGSLPLGRRGGGDGCKVEKCACLPACAERAMMVDRGGKEEKGWVSVDVEGREREGRQW